jgi:hypothetical protein
MSGGEDVEGSEGPDLYYQPVKLYTVMMPSMGEYKLNAVSFMTTEDNHLLFLDDEGEVCARFKSWDAVMEIKVAK